MIIDKDKYITEVDHIVHSVHDGENLLHLVHIPLIRCKDCKYWTEDVPHNAYCKIMKLHGFEPDDFCSRGERKDEQD